MKVENESSSEFFLQYFWSKVKENDSFFSERGEKIVIKYRGRWNFEGGPDFVGASAIIDGAPKIGDIEIHNSENDWVIHGHHKDEKYSNVILHVVRKNSRHFNNKNEHNPKCPLIYLDESSLTHFKLPINKPFEKYKVGKCSDCINSKDSDKIRSIFESIGLFRFNKKAAISLDNIISNGLNDTFFLFLFESLGFKNNRKEFKELYRRVSGYYYNETPLEIAVASIWGESGLLPDVMPLDIDDSMKSEILSLWEIWWKIRKDNYSRLQWSRVGRPSNSVWRRIAGLQCLLKKLDSFSVDKISEIIYGNSDDKNRELIDLFCCQDDFWGCYSSFSKKSDSNNKSLIGESRAISIIGNLVLPFYYAVALINKNDSQRTLILSLWKSLPRSGEAGMFINITCERLRLSHEKRTKVIKTFAAEQGIIAIFKNFCEYLHMNCKDCSLYTEFIDLKE